MGIKPSYGNTQHQSNVIYLRPVKSLNIRIITTPVQLRSVKLLYRWRTVSLCGAKDFTKKTLRELTEYTNDIAHWWTDTIDENYLADLRRTINELIRRRYF